MKSTLIPVLVLAILFSCSGNKPGKQQAPEVKTVKYVQMMLDSNSNYQVLVPENYKITGGTVIDFTSYHVLPKDSADHGFGTAYINFSANLDGKPFPHDGLVKDSLIPGKVLDKPVEWTVYQYSEFITATTYTKAYGHVYIGFDINAPSYANLDSLIRIVSSVNRIN